MNAPARPFRFADAAWIVAGDYRTAAMEKTYATIARAFAGTPCTPWPPEPRPAPAPVPCLWTMALKEELTYADDEALSVMIREAGLSRSHAIMAEWAGDELARRQALSERTA